MSLNASIFGSRFVCAIGLLFCGACRAPAVDSVPRSNRDAGTVQSSPSSAASDNASRSALNGAADTASPPSGPSEPTDLVGPEEFEETPPGSQGVRDAGDSEFDALSPLDRGERALAQQDYEAAAAWFEEAIEKDPSRSVAYYQLAVCREALRDIPAAIEAYKALLETAEQISWRELARSRLEALRRSHGRDLLFRSAIFAETGAVRSALDVLRRAVDMELPPALDQRARREYFRLHAEAKARDILDICMAEGRLDIAVADAIPASPEFAFQARDFSRLLESSLAGTRSLTVIPLNLSTSLRAILATLPTYAWAGGGIEELDGPVVVGRFGATALTRLVDPQLADVLYESMFTPAAVPPPFMRDALWTRLPETWRERRRLDPEVWAESETIGPTDGMWARFRPSEDCFAAVYQLGENGDLAKLAPKETGQWPFVQGGEAIRLELRPSARRSPKLAALWAVAGQSQQGLPEQVSTAGELVAWAEKTFAGPGESAWAASLYVFRVLPPDRPVR